MRKNLRLWMTRISASTAAVIEAWLSEPGYHECVGTHRRTAPPGPLEQDAVMFTMANHERFTGPAR